MRKAGVLLAAAAFFLASNVRAEDLCPATGAKGAVTQISYKDGHVVASGTWEVTGGATGAMLELRIDNDRYQGEMQTGTSGTWSVTQSFHVCDRPVHVVRVVVYPVVPGGKGRWLHCLERSHRSEPAQFQFPCSAQIELDHCVWECEEGEAAGCTGTCSGTASGGKPPYILYEGMGGPAEQKTSEPTDSAWSFRVDCKRGEKVSFVVRDNYGRGKPMPPVERLCGEP